MKRELKRIEPLRMANIAAVVYGALMGAFVIVILPVIAVVNFLGASRGAGPGEFVLITVVVLVYPVIGAIVGWIGGLLSGAVYNLVVRWTGGLLVEIEDPGEASSVERA